MQQIFRKTLDSKLLQREISYQVILPPKPHENPPVLYLLHGLFGSCENWLELTKIKEYLTGKDFITVLADGENGWYSDSVIVENNQFESYFLGELMPALESKYRTGKRAIAGLSMGGYGAFKFSLKRPELFCFAGSMSGAFDAPHRLKPEDGFGAEELNSSIFQAFGEGKTQSKIDNDIFQLAKNCAPAQISELPEIYFDCGIEDGFLEINRDFSELLKEKQISHEFREVKGGHDWIYWDSQIQIILEKVAEVFKRK